MEETLVAPGLAVTEVKHAPPASDHESKRVPVFEEVEHGMVGRMGHLRKQTLEKNKEFVRQLNAISARRVKLEAKIEEEVKARAVQFDAIKTELSATLAEFKEEFAVAAKSTSEALQVQLDGTDARMDGDVEVEEEFYTKTVPAVNEEQTGQLVRQMLRSRESFDIDNANLRAREAVLISRFDKHCEATAERFKTEGEDRYESQCTLRESLSAWTSVSEREEAASQVRTLKALVEGKGMLDTEASRREAADLVVLQNLQQGMAAAQQIVLECFGQV